MVSLKNRNGIIFPFSSFSSFVSRYYIRDENHNLKNAPYVDNSCKWAGGGLLSNVNDLCKFGNAMLYSSQYKEPAATATAAATGGAAADKKKSKALPGYLKPETMAQIWEPVVRMAKKPESLSDAAYGMGWMIMPKIKERAFARDLESFKFHTGGAVGASSVLLVLPTADGLTKGNNGKDGQEQLPQGVVVAVICNMECVSLTKLASEIAKDFQILGQKPETKLPLHEL